MFFFFLFSLPPLQLCVFIDDGQVPYCYYEHSLTFQNLFFLQFTTDLLEVSSQNELKWRVKCSLHRMGLPDQSRISRICGVWWPSTVAKRLSNMLFTDALCNRVGSQLGVKNIVVIFMEFSLCQPIKALKRCLIQGASIQCFSAM